jgi:hypothetical protein
MVEIVERSSGNFTSPCIQSPPGHIIEVLVLLHPAAILLIRNANHHCHQPLLLLLGILVQASIIAWHKWEADSLHGPPEKCREWTFSKVQAMYLLLVVGLRWRWICCNGWLWIIIWVLITTICCS